MRINLFRRLVLLAIGPFLVSSAGVQAQTLRGPYYHRTTTPGFVAPRGAVSPTSREVAPERGGGTMDLLRPYTATSSRAGVGAEGEALGNSYSSHPRVAPPITRPPAPVSAHNYYPTARIGQGPNRNVAGFGRGGGGHCTPSRGGMIFGLR